MLVELSVMEQRYQAVLAVIQDGWKVVEVAERLGVSRQAVHAWIARYEQGGLASLADRSHRPASCPHQIAPEIEAMICELRRQHPGWGPRRIQHQLARRGHVHLRCPAPSGRRRVDRPARDHASGQHLVPRARISGGDPAVRRTFARLGLLTVVVAAPIALGTLVGSPAIPDFAGSDGLSGSFVPVAAVLRLVGLLSWGLWAYLTFAIVLHAAATIAAVRHAPGQGVPARVSSILTPKVVRSLVELAIGSALVAGSVSVRASSALPVTSRPMLVEAAPIHSAADVFDEAGTSEPAKVTYRVRAGDSLSRIAERELGSGFRWRELYRLNEARRFTDGRSLTDPHLIYPRVCV